MKKFAMVLALAVMAAPMAVTAQPPGHGQKPSHNNGNGPGNRPPGHNGGPGHGASHGKPSHNNGRTRQRADRRILPPMAENFIPTSIIAPVRRAIAIASTEIPVSIAVETGAIIAVVMMARPV